MLSSEFLHPGWCFGLGRGVIAGDIRFDIQDSGSVQSIESFNLEYVAVVFHYLDCS